MEYGLWGAVADELRKGQKVLILVLMEYGLWELLNSSYVDC
mgnify:CR=1 FL=1